MDSYVRIEVQPRDKKNAKPNKLQYHIHSRIKDKERSTFGSNERSRRKSPSKPEDSDRRLKRQSNNLDIRRHTPYSSSDDVLQSYLSNFEQKRQNKQEQKNDIQRLNMEDSGISNFQQNNTVEAEKQHLSYVNKAQNEERLFQTLVAHKITTMPNLANDKMTKTDMNTTDPSKHITVSPTAVDMLRNKPNNPVFHEHQDLDILQQSNLNYKENNEEPVSESTFNVVETCKMDRLFDRSYEDERNLEESHNQTNYEAVTQKTRSLLRERFLKLLIRLSGGVKCKARIFENAEVMCRVKAFHPNFDNILVEELQTAHPKTIERAVLRSNDLISLEFYDLNVHTLFNDL